MPRLLCVLVTFLLVSPLATAEIFKCPGKNGKTIYQNFPCEVDSIGSSATAVAPKEEDASAPPTAPVQAQPEASAVRVAATSKALGPRVEPRVGMTTAEVKASTWGEPVRTENTEIMEGLIEIWYYGDKRTVQFDHKGRVRLVEQ